MNEFRIRATGQVVSEQVLRLSRKEVLPVVIDAAACDFCGVDPVLLAPAPSAGQYEDVVRDGARLDTLGNWVQAWRIVPWTAEQVAAAQDAARAAISSYLNEVRDLREKLLNRLMGIGFAADKVGDLTTSEACVAARQRLLDITKIPGVTAAASVEDAKAAVRAEYLSIVASVPAALINAFDKVDT